MTACTQYSDRLLDYVLGALAPAATRPIEEHVETCSGCAAALDELKRKRTELDRALAELVQAEPPAGFYSRVVRKAEQSHTAWLPVPVWWKALSAAAALALVAVLLYQPGRPDPLVEFARQAYAWRAPTDALLSTPGGQSLSAELTVGDYYFEFDSTDSDRTVAQEEEN